MNIRQSWLAVLLASLMVAPLACKRPVAPKPQGPRLVFDATAHNFGQVLGGATLVHNFVFRNAGDQPLAISAVSTGCDCTTALPAQRELAPGQTSRIEVKYDTTGYETETRNVIYVMSNDPRAPRTELVVAADIELPLAFAPRDLKLVTDDPAHRVERIWAYGRFAGQARLRVGRVEGDAAKYVGVRAIEQTGDQGSRQGLEFKLKSRTAPPGSGRVVVATGIPDPSEVAIGFSWGPSR